VCAVVVHADIHDWAEARRDLNHDVLPQMRPAPGLHRASCIRLDDTHGVSVALFETEEQSRAGGHLRREPRHRA
jgi:hypothetical protein